jgi:hypothetical protein
MRRNHRIIGDNSKQYQFRFRAAVSLELFQEKAVDVLYQSQEKRRASGPQVSTNKEYKSIKSMKQLLANQKKEKVHASSVW